MAAEDHHHHHGHHHREKRKINLGDYDTEEKILDAIEQSRRITRLIISAVQKGSKFEVSQILEHYGLRMTARLHFKIVNIVMEQWFSLMGHDDEEQIWNILQNNKWAMEKIAQLAPGGTMVLSDLLSEWELPIGALQSKIIRRIQVQLKEQKEKQDKNEKNDNNGDANNAKNDDQKEN